MEVEKEVKTVKVDYRCDECDFGFMRPTGTCFPTNPPQYIHKCNNEHCGQERIFNVSYPFIDYKDAIQ